MSGYPIFGNDVVHWDDDKQDTLPLESANNRILGNIDLNFHSCYWYTTVLDKCYLASSSLHIPNCSITLWLELFDRLLIKDKMIQFQVKVHDINLCDV